MFIDILCSVIASSKCILRTAFCQLEIQRIYLHTQCTNGNYTVSQKNIPDVFSYNTRKR